MSIKQTDSGLYIINLKDMHVSIGITKKGNIDIGVHGMPKDIFSNLTELLGKDFQQHNATTWFSMSKARDGSQVTFYRK